MAPVLDRTDTGLDQATLNFDSGARRDELRGAGVRRHTKWWTSPHPPPTGRTSRVDFCVACESAATSRCPSCGRAICDTHRIDADDGCCTECAERDLTALSNSGKRTASIGLKIALSSLIFLTVILYVGALMPSDDGLTRGQYGYAFPADPPIWWLALVVVGCIGAGLGILVVIDGALIAPRLARRKVQAGHHRSSKAPPKQAA